MEGGQPLCRSGVSDHLYDLGSPGARAEICPQNETQATNPDVGSDGGCPEVYSPAATSILSSLNVNLDKACKKGVEGGEKRIFGFSRDSANLLWASLSQYQWQRVCVCSPSNLLLNSAKIDYGIVFNDSALLFALIY